MCVVCGLSIVVRCGLFGVYCLLLFWLLLVIVRQVLLCCFDVCFLLLVVRCLLFLYVVRVVRLLCIGGPLLFIMCCCVVRCLLFVVRCVSFVVRSFVWMVVYWCVLLLFRNSLPVVSLFSFVVVFVWGCLRVVCCWLFVVRSCILRIACLLFVCALFVIRCSLFFFDGVVCLSFVVCELLVDWCLLAADSRFFKKKKTCFVDVCLLLFVAF